MKASEVIERLQELMEKSGRDPEVLCQSQGCCRHGHKIKSSESINFDTVDDENDIVIHV